jgi:hypothetical protein
VVASPTPVSPTQPMCVLFGLFNYSTIYLFITAQRSSFPLNNSQNFFLQSDGFFALGRTPSKNALPNKRQFSSNLLRCKFTDST